MSLDWLWEREMLLRRRPAAVNLGQTKYFHRSSGVPLSVRTRVGREMGKNCLLPYMEMSFYFPYFQTSYIKYGNAHLFVFVVTRKHINRLHYIIDLSSFLTLQFNVCEFLNCILLTIPWTSSSSRVTGTSPSSLWLTDEVRKLCFNSHLTGFRIMKPLSGNLSVDLLAYA